MARPRRGALSHALGRRGGDGKARGRHRAQAGSGAAQKAAPEDAAAIGTRLSGRVPPS
ncbi:hypothetical protein MTBSS4_200051 [Magnetospirillum sp. SS-4]|nr:hypothetical protein MTBSS4_200051 [Magnetospirillum sp. SS-4]